MRGFTSPKTLPAAFGEVWAALSAIVAPVPGGVDVFRQLGDGWSGAQVAVTIDQILRGCPGRPCVLELNLNVSNGIFSF
jgi:hypothetical protein